MSQIFVDLKYKNLCQYLSQHDYKSADIETRILLLKAAGQMKRGWLDDKVDIPMIPDTDLLIIYRLWQKYSNLHFGFSTQSRILKSIPSNIVLHDDERYLYLSMLVGWWISDDYPVYETLFTPNRYNFHSQELDINSGRWLEYYELNFSTIAPQGHFPIPEDSGVFFALLAKFEEIANLRHNKVTFDIKYDFQEYDFQEIV